MKKKKMNYCVEYAKYNNIILSYELNFDVLFLFNLIFFFRFFRTEQQRKQFNSKLTYLIDRFIILADYIFPICDVIAS